MIFITSKCFGLPYFGVKLTFISSTATQMAVFRHGALSSWVIIWLCDCFKCIGDWLQPQLSPADKIITLTLSTVRAPQDWFSLFKVSQYIHIFGLTDDSLCLELLAHTCLRGVANFRLHFLFHFFLNFENLSAHNVANILNFPKHVQHSHFEWVESRYGHFSKNRHIFGTPCRINNIADVRQCWRTGQFS